MSAIWFKKSDVARLGGEGVAIDDDLAVGDLERVAAAVLPGSGPIRARLSFETTDTGTVLLTGRLGGAVRQICQRCLEEMEIAVRCRLRVAIVPDETVSFPDGFEAVLAPTGELRLIDLVEDEILLGLPAVSRHAEKNCGPLSSKLEALERPETNIETTKPFADLADLMRDGRH